MSANPFFTLNVHGTICRARAGAGALILDIEHAHGPDIAIFTGDHELSEKLTAAINETLAAHRAPRALEAAE